MLSVSRPELHVIVTLISQHTSHLSREQSLNFMSSSRNQQKWRPLKDHIKTIEMKQWIRLGALSDTQFQKDQTIIEGWQQKIRKSLCKHVMLSDQSCPYRYMLNMNQLSSLEKEQWKFVLKDQIINEGRLKWHKCHISTVSYSSNLSRGHRDKWVLGSCSALHMPSTITLPASMKFLGHVIIYS